MSDPTVTTSPEIPQIDRETTKTDIDAPPLKAKRIRYGRGHTKIDVKEAVKLRMKGASYSQIAKQYDVYPSAVHNSIAPLFKMIQTPDTLRTFRDKEVDIIDSAKMKVLFAAMNDRAIKKSNGLQLTTMYCQLFDKKQLITGRPTSLNVLSVLIRSAHNDKPGKQEVIQPTIEIKDSDNNELS